VPLGFGNDPVEQQWHDPTRQNWAEINVKKAGKTSNITAGESPRQTTRKQKGPG